MNEYQWVHEESAMTRKCFMGISKARQELLQEFLLELNATSATYMYMTYERYNKYMPIMGIFIAEVAPNYYGIKNKEEK